MLPGAMCCEEHHHHPLSSIPGSPRTRLERISGKVKHPTHCLPMGPSLLLLCHPPSQADWICSAVGQTPRMTTGRPRRLKIQIDDRSRAGGVGCHAMCEIRRRPSPWRWIGPCWSMLYVRENEHEHTAHLRPLASPPSTTSHMGCILPMRFRLERGRELTSIAALAPC